MRIAFSGHRDKTCDADLFRALATEYAGATWVHGGAVGFDTQVEEIARECGVPTAVIRPDYAQHGKRAPLLRNLAIIYGADLLVALWDGRTTGGTYFTVEAAGKAGTPVYVIRP